MSNIKINDVPQRIQYSAASGQTQFTVPFPFFANAYVYVWLNGIQLFQGGSPGQYTVTGAGSPSGGLVTFNTASTLNDIVTIEGIMPIDRTSIYSPTISNLTGSDLNGDFNREVVMMQQINTVQQFLQLQYAPWEEVSQDLNVTRDRYLPILQPQQVFRMNEAGTAFEGYTLDNVPAPSDSYFITWGADPALENEQNLGLLVSGLLKNNVAGGFATISRAVNAQDYWAPGDVIILPGLPVDPNDAASKAYVDTVSGGFSFVSPVTVATTGNLASTYDNGAAGIGSTLTADANGAANIDGVALSLNDRVLFKDQTDTFENGVYQVNSVGDGSNPAVFIRTTDFDTPAEIVPGILVPVLEGTVNQFTIWLNTSDPTTIGTDPIVFAQFGISSANIVTISGNQTITGDKEFTGVVEVPTPTTGTEAANKDYVDNAIPTNTGLIAFTAITVSGTWNRAPGATKAIIMPLGAGGGGSGATGVTGSFLGTGDGGGAGESAWLELDISAISSATVTIGAGGAGGPAAAGSTGGSAGGTTSFGTHVTAAGGSGGNAMTTDGVTRYGTGGAGGTGGTGGDIQCPGFNGSWAYRNGASNAISGGGASSAYGCGGLPIPSTGGVDSNGNAATGYGSGGGAAMSSSSAQRAGAAGRQGLCLVWEY